MNTLDNKIQEALASATDLPEDVTAPNLAEELLGTLQGRHSWLMKWGVVKMVIAVIAMCICTWQFFMQESQMAMIAYATAVVLCTVGYAAVFLFIWIQMNHNTTVGEIKRLELQVALLTRQLKDSS